MRDALSCSAPATCSRSSFVFVSRQGREATGQQHGHAAWGACGQQNGSSCFHLCLAGDVLPDPWPCTGCMTAEGWTLCLVEPSWSGPDPGAATDAEAKCVSCMLGQHGATPDRADTATGHKKDAQTGADCDHSAAHILHLTNCSPPRTNDATSRHRCPALTQVPWEI